MPPAGHHGYTVRKADNVEGDQAGRAIKHTGRAEQRLRHGQRHIADVPINARVAVNGVFLTVPPAKKGREIKIAAPCMANPQTVETSSAVAFSAVSSMERKDCVMMAGVTI